MFNVMELRTIYFQTLVSMVCIGYMCVVNGRQQAAEVAKAGVGRPLLELPKSLQVLCWSHT